ncbi:hypothetical protein FRC17_008129 [Serendipita sp. 399]|nr:hypothetical protein FRC17_008129 [Serendipita sp. 399]
MFGTSSYRRLVNARPRLLPTLRETCPYAITLSKTPRINTFHTSASTNESARKQKARLRKQEQRDKRAEKARLAEQNKPHPALGYAPGKEDVWKKSELYSIILKPQDLSRLPIPKVEIEMTEEKVVERDEYGREITTLTSSSTTPKTTGRMVPHIFNERPLVTQFDLPEIFNFGVDEAGQTALFTKLADLRTIDKALEPLNTNLIRREGRKGEEDEEEGHNQYQQLSEATLSKREDGLRYWTARALDLRNANAAGIAMENRSRIVTAFSGPERPFNPGRAEVQAALLTARIHNLWEHLQKSRRDIHNRHNLMALIQARAKILRWFRRTERARYEALLPRIGVERGAVEGEIIMRREMYRETATHAAR